jgi:hypothetical protein
MLVKRLYRYRWEFEVIAGLEILSFSTPAQLQGTDHMNQQGSR